MQWQVSIKVCLTRTPFCCSYPDYYNVVATSRIHMRLSGTLPIPLQNWAPKLNPRGKPRPSEIFLALHDFLMGRPEHALRQAFDGMHTRHLAAAADARVATLL